MSTEETKPKKKKKGFFAAIGDVFYESTETTSENTEDTHDEEEISVSNTGDIDPSLIQALNIPTSGDGVFDKNFEKMLLDVIESNNLPGVDYYEFQKAIKQMNNGGMNESTLFQTVFNSLRIADSNLTVETLMSSVDHYVAKMREEEAEFESEMQNSISAEVVAKREQAKALNEQNKEYLAQIQELNTKMSENSNKALELNNEADLANNKITQTQKNFIVTMASIISGLESDKTKISQLIK